MIRVARAFVFVAALQAVHGDAASDEAFDRPLVFVDGPWSYLGDELPLTAASTLEIRLREKLRTLAAKYAARSDIPYVWGGASVGSVEDCLACRRCVASESKDGFLRRRERCEPCQRCGLDCSNFVHRLYREVGLDYPFASTGELLRLPPLRLEALYGLIDLGTDLEAARPGDLLLYKGHVTMLWDHQGGGKGAFVHITRGNDARGDAGRIEIRSVADLAKAHGGLKRVLRHGALHGGAARATPLVVPLGRLEEREAGSDRG